MNNKLYRIKELHGGPKSHATFTKEFILAEDDEACFNYIAYTEGLDQWKEENFKEYPEDYNEESFEEFKKEIMEDKGDIESEDGWDDAYYGVWKHGWEFVSEVTEEEICVLRKLGILEEEKCSQ